MTTPTATDATIETRLARIKHHRTRYELVASHADGRRVLVGYTPGRGRDGILRSASIEGRAEALVRLTGSESITFAKRAKDGATMGEWAIGFSGRTQRDCILGTGGPELVYVEDAADRMIDGE